MRIAPFSNNSAQEDDFGFGDRIANPGVSLMRKDGNFNVDRSGGTRFAYQWLIDMHWLSFSGVILLYYILINALFAFAYLALGIDGITGIETSTWMSQYASLFFFSVQTFTTVGYGLMAPLKVGHQLLAALEALVGLLSLALATGLLFARFSRPQNLIVFSSEALVSPYQDGMAFQFRLASRVASKLINVSAHVLFSWIDPDTPAGRKRRFASLSLERSQIAMFPLNWTVVHPIDETSPLSNRDKKWLASHDVEFVVQISAYDETYARQIYAHTSYRAECLHWNALFAPMYRAGKKGRTILELDKIGEVISGQAIKPPSGLDVQHE